MTGLMETYRLNLKKMESGQANKWERLEAVLIETNKTSARSSLAKEL
jgi:hypothetical protein